MRGNTLKIAICHYGITRHPETSGPSIAQNIVAPAKEFGEVRIFAHLFDLRRIDNRRSAESVVLDQGLNDRVVADVKETEPPIAFRDTALFRDIAQFGDHWDDGFASLHNLMHQLHSLRRVTLMACDWAPDVFVFCRPDLRYLDSLKAPIARAARSSEPLCITPFWQRHGGLNDRYAVIRGAGPAKAYGLRGDRALDYCQTTGRPLHAERLTGYVMAEAAQRPCRPRAVRVRSTGREVDEDFRIETAVRWSKDLEFSTLPHQIKRLGHVSLRQFDRLIALGLYGAGGRKT